MFGSGSGASPRTRRLARLASCRVAGAVRPTIGAISSKGTVEHVVKHESEPLRRRQVLEHDEQRKADRVGEQCLLLGIPVGFDAHNRLRQPAAGVVLAPGAPRLQHVEADSADDGGQPAADVPDVVRVGATQAQPRLLDGVLRLADRTEHPVGDGLEVAAVALELLRAPALLVHVGHTVRSGVVIGVTSELRPM